MRITDDLILWLAYKEAKALLKIDAAPAANWLTLALADHRRGEIDQAKKACRKAAEMLKLAGGADEALRPLLRQAVFALGTESPEAKDLIAAAAGEPPAALNEAIQQHPDQAKGYRDRGNWYGERGRWKDAIADFAEVFRLEPNSYDGMKLAFLLAQNGEKKRFQEHAQVVLSQWGSTEANEQADLTLKAISLLPDVKADVGQLDRLAQAAVAGDEKRALFEWFLFGKGLHEYRTGKNADALTTCRASRQRRDNQFCHGGSDVPGPGGRGHGLAGSGEGQRSPPHAGPSQTIDRKPRPRSGRRWCVARLGVGAHSVPRGRRCCWRRRRPNRKSNRRFVLPTKGASRCPIRSRSPASSASAWQKHGCIPEWRRREDG